MRFGTMVEGDIRSMHWGIPLDWRAGKVGGRSINCVKAC